MYLALVAPVCHSERSEESVVALSVRLHLLFLPAAGTEEVGKGGMMYFNEHVYLHVADCNTEAGSYRWQFSDAGVVLAGRSRCRRYSVRLACVVSEDLTEVWKKCQSVVIPWPPCHSERSEESVVALLVRLHLLFLPAAGWRETGSIRNVHDWGRYWSSTVADDTSAYMWYYTAASLRLPYYFARNLFFSIRLASVVSEESDRRCLFCSFLLRVILGLVLAGIAVWLFTLPSSVRWLGLRIMSAMLPGSGRLNVFLFV